jgi:hypothetical protein
MKKILDKEAREREAIFWTKMSEAAKKNTGTLCHK